MGIARRLDGCPALERDTVRSFWIVIVGLLLAALSACGSDDVPDVLGGAPEPTANDVEGHTPTSAPNAVDETTQSERQVTADNDTDADADADGVVDDEDNCPNDHNPDQRDVCTEDPGARGGCPPASVFLARHDSVVENKRLLVVDAPSCEEGIPREVLPPRGSTVVAVVGDLTYVLIDEESADLPAGGVEIEGGVLDMSAPPQTGSIGNAELAEVISVAVSTGKASTVAAALTPQAESFISPTIWSQVVALNPDLVAGGGGVAVDGGGVVAP